MKKWYLRGGPLTTRSGVRIPRNRVCSFRPVTHIHVRPFRWGCKPTYNDRRRPVCAGRTKITKACVSYKIVKMCWERNLRGSPGSNRSPVWSRRILVKLGSSSPKDLGENTNKHHGNLLHSIIKHLKCLTWRHSPMQSVCKTCVKETPPHKTAL